MPSKLPTLPSESVDSNFFIWEGLGTSHCNAGSTVAWCFTEVASGSAALKGQSSQLNGFEWEVADL